MLFLFLLRFIGYYNHSSGYFFSKDGKVYTGAINRYKLASSIQPMASPSVAEQRTTARLRADLTSHGVAYSD